MIPSTDVEIRSLLFDVDSRFARNGEDVWRRLNCFYQSAYSELEGTNIPG